MKPHTQDPFVVQVDKLSRLTFGPSAAGVLLTGADDDGTAGLQAIKRRAAS